MVNLAAGRNWLDCTVKLIFLCQLLIQGYMISDCNLIMLPYVNTGNLRLLKEQFCQLLGINRTELSIPALKSYMVGDKDISRNISSILATILGGKASYDTIKMINDLPVLIVQTSIINIEDNTSLEIQANSQNLMDVRGSTEAKCMFILELSRECSNKMNVFSKKFNKQKEEFWFLIFAAEKKLIFRKFSFNRKNKKIEFPIYLRRGMYF